MVADLDLLVEAAAVHGQLAAGADPAVVAARATDRRLVLVAASGHKRGRSVEWTEAEDAFLRANLGQLADEEIARVLGRSAVAVRIRWRRGLRLTAPSKAPSVLTTNQIANGLGIDSHTAIRLVDRGYLPARTLPFTFGGRLTRRVRVVDRVTLLRWMVNPLHWIYFDPERIGMRCSNRGTGKFEQDREFWEKARALVLRRRALWDDEWWRIGQVADYHGLDHRLVNKAIHEGRLPAVDWGNWWVLRSDATRPGLKLGAYLGKGGPGTFHTLNSPGAEAFIVLAHSVGISAPGIGRMMRYQLKCIDQRLRLLRLRDRIPWIIRAHQLPVAVNRRGDLLADWKALRHRFPRVARAMDRLRRGAALGVRELELVRGVLKAWCRFHARTQAQYAMVRGLHGVNRRNVEHFRAMVRQMRAWGFDPYRRLST